MPTVLFVVTTPFAVNAFLRAHIFKLSTSFRVVLCVNRDSYPLSPEILDCAQIHHIPFVRKIALLADLQTAWQLYQLIRQVRPDVVHSITPKAGLLTMFAGRLARVPHRWHTFTGQVWVNQNGPMRVLLKNVDHALALLATKVFADSASQARFLCAEGIVHSKRIRVLGPGSITGVDIKKFQPNAASRIALRNSLGTAADAVVFLFVGRLVRDKGIFDLVQAFNNLAYSRSGLELWFVGPDEESLSDTVIAAALPHSAPIRYFGPTQTPEDFMSTADVLVLPSYREGFGSVIIEAGACGIPSIAYSVDGVVDALIDQVTGLLVKVGDTGALKDAMKVLADNPVFLHRLGAEARKRAVSSFDSEIVTDAWLRHYQSELLIGVTHKHHFIRRFIDIALAAGISIFSLPVIAAVYLTVVATSPGPAIYWSDRVGQRNRIFKMPKFRTMRVDTPAVATHLLPDPKQVLTPIGSFLRRSSLDELPQLWSILKGDMSFVGPRPALFNQYDLIALRTECGVDALVPGLTGWAQVNGRDALSIADKVQFDLQYLENRSLLMDLKILYMTFIKVLRRAEVSH